MDRIDLIAMRQPDMWPLRDHIRTLGTDNLSHFGNGYTHEGDHSLQQNPDELAALTLLLIERKSWWDRGGAYFEIGSASGGTLRWLHGQLCFGAILVIDDGGHHRFPEQEGNFAGIALRKYIGDSHSTAAKEWLLTELASRAYKLGSSLPGIDVAFIDGDHSYEGVAADVQLVRPHLHKDSIVIFHDTVACDGVRRVWEESINTFLVPLANYTGPERPLGIGVGSVR